MMVRISRVREVNTHQHDFLLVDRDQCCNSTFVDVCSPRDLSSPLHVQKYSNTVFVLEFPEPIKLCVLDVTPTSLPFSVSTSRKVIEHPICTPRLLSQFLRLCHLFSSALTLLLYHYEGDICFIFCFLCLFFFSCCCRLRLSCRSCFFTSLLPPSQDLPFLFFFCCFAAVLPFLSWSCL